MPEVGIEQRLAVNGLGRHCLGHQTAAVIHSKTPAQAGFQGFFIGVVGIQRAPLAHHFQQAFAVLAGQRLVQAMLVDGLAQQFGNMPLKVGLHLAITLRLATKRLGGMHHGVVIDLNKGLQRDTELMAVIEHCMVMVRDTPRSGIEVQALIKLALLGRTAQLGKAVTTAQRPATPARLGVELQHLDLIPGFTQFVSGSHARKPCPENQSTGALGRAAQGKIALVGGFCGKAQGAHCLIHRSGTRCHTDPVQHLAAAHNHCLLLHDQSFEAKEDICACKGLEQGLCQPVKTTKNEENFIKIRMRMHRHRSCAAAFGARRVRHQWAQQLA